MKLAKSQKKKKKKKKIRKKKVKKGNLCGTLGHFSNEKNPPGTLSS